jgi:L-threonylcarbamoyladenylate synthase
LEKNWPASLSVRFACSLKKFEYLHRGINSLVFRMPKKKKIRDILKQTGPLVAPSANHQGQKPAETIREAKNYFKKDIKIFISGGKLTGNPSTIVSLLEEKAKILRQGGYKIKN